MVNVVYKNVCGETASYLRKQRPYGRGLWFIGILTSNYPWSRLKTFKVKPLCKNY